MRGDLRLFGSLGGILTTETGEYLDFHYQAEDDFNQRFTLTPGAVA